MSSPTVVNLDKQYIIEDGIIYGYKFVCSNIPTKCKECERNKKIFTSRIVEVAYEHGKRNNMPMKIEKDNDAVVFGELEDDSPN